MTLCDVSEKALDNGREIIQKSIARIAKKEHPTDATAQNTLVARVFDAIRMTTDPGDAVVDANLVVEAIVEKLEAKQALFRQLDAIAAKECVFATNTSSLSVREIASSTCEDRRRRCETLIDFPVIYGLKRLIDL